MARCIPSAMRPARLMGATYAALLDRMQRRGWSQPESAVRLPKWQKLWIALRFAMMTLPPRPRRRRRARRARGGAVAGRARRPGHAARGRAGRRRALPVVFRPRARLPDRQRQPPAALRQPGRLRLPRPGRLARHAGRTRRAAVPVHGSRDRRALDPAPQPWPAAAVDLQPEAARARARRLRDYLQLAGAAPGRTGRDRGAGASRPARSTAACSSRSRSRRSTRRRRPASARLLAAVVAESLADGGAACIPAFPREGLSESFIDPALAWLAAARRRRSGFGEPGRGDRTRRTAGPPRSAPMPLGPTKPSSSPCRRRSPPRCCPGTTVPDQFEAILNVHFRIDAEPGRGRVHRPGRRHRRVGVRQARRGQRDDLGRQPRVDTRAGGLGATSVAGSAHGARASPNRCRLGAW